MTTKQAISRLVEDMTDEEAQDLLDYLEDRDIYTPEVLERIRIGREEIARGDFVTIEEFKAELGL